MINKASAILLLIITLTSCHKKIIIMSEDSFFGDKIFYGVIMATYVHIYQDLNNPMSDREVLRRGDFVYILQSKHVKNELGEVKTFYYIKTNAFLKGWVSAESIEPFKYKKTALLRQKTMAEDVV